MGNHTNVLRDVTSMRWLHYYNVPKVKFTLHFAFYIVYMLYVAIALLQPERVAVLLPRVRRQLERTRRAVAQPDVRHEAATVVEVDLGCGVRVGTSRRRSTQPPLIAAPTSGAAHRGLLPETA